MLYVVGLGNPGPKYDGTRHNVGFDVIDELAERHRFPTEKKFGSSLVRRDRIRGQEVLLVKPMTYMNLSGDAVGAIVRFYKGNINDGSDIIVVHDDLDFE
ncbi:MAG: aminoacyl-tRNA hydrolase, partial [Myxococcota bacterium]